MSSVETLQLDSLQEAPKRPSEVLASSEEGQVILTAIYNAPALMEQKSGSDIHDDEPLGRLKSKLFINTTNLKSKPVDVILNIDNIGEPIQIPLDLVVNAYGFNDWTGRPKNVKKTISTDEGYLTFECLELINRYAQMESEAPTIPEFDMFIQPDGKVFFGNSIDGSHRLAAAILRGKKSVPTLSLRVRHIDDLIF